jgi:hypothetical protein
MLPLIVNVTVDMEAAAPFKHKWKESFGSGHASLTLRADWRGKQLTRSSCQRYTTRIALGPNSSTLPQLTCPPASVRIGNSH